MPCIFTSCLVTFDCMLHSLWILAAACDNCSHLTHLVHSDHVTLGQKADTSITSVIRPSMVVFWWVACHSLFTVNLAVRERSRHQHCCWVACSQMKHPPPNKQIQTSSVVTHHTRWIDEFYGDHLTWREKIHLTSHRSSPTLISPAAHRKHTQEYSQTRRWQT